MFFVELVGELVELAVEFGELVAEVGEFLFGLFAAAAFEVVFSAGGG